MAASRVIIVVLMYHIIGILAKKNSCFALEMEDPTFPTIIS
jgi:hypothetical protein